MSTSGRRRGRGGQGGHEPRTRIRTRELRTLELATLGWSQHQIAADLGISQAAVSKILKRIELRLLQDMTETVERQKARQTVRLEYLFAEAMGAWEHSKTDSTRRRQRKTQAGTGGAGATVAEIVTENQHGDPRYLDEARKALADHRKIWGLDAPQKVDVRATRDPYDHMTDDDLRAELARQARLLIGPEATIPDSTHPSSPGPATPARPEVTHVDAQ
jgi:transcriptional regulator with XRE-family HTH domain